MSIFNFTFQNSSMLSSVSYDDDSRELTVTFNNRKEYVYVDVDLSDYIDLTEAISPGAYFNSIKSGLKIKNAQALQ